ncbi:hypothetical protein [Dictyobacter aurantiacus]|uniref:Transposase IS4-like domain-containing protein n=1 Tax=Dictyobacter aurantiacus TaxID=1936993 RepID=A0A401ZCQ6_9CHLR|nr:hypothetical protein [Dictyobacter aurantiacus]GCE02682.1 hypothetical protein KDAU_00110 [Dictyobacter aurantiacus]GCE04478.1 hypothetical protein KDAU_18070 [Dictyobacter aurantiacus]GCE07765.1 hypothetical protein KDAU_50940 [Dictyobacter aurantiacus]GCE07786.1 hypothetical protein KDAU_51150 [Dictyobacter aurantiacus]GCE10131.1 hypothetical protein KDAU_74600 [Dictyobacter aurantiacus]
MNRHHLLSQWSDQVSTAFPHLRSSQLNGLVLWSVGMTLLGACGWSQISALLACVLGQSEDAVAQRLREWYLDAHDKCGDKRREIEVSTCFASLLRWVVRCCGPHTRRMALALDATTLGERWTVLSICVVLRSCSIPVAWKVLGAHEKGSWRPHWEGLLAHLHGCVPGEWFVIVMADRGLYAQWLYEGIRTCGWHPFLRINGNCKARRVGSDDFEMIAQWVPTPGLSWKGRVECFASKQARVNATVLVHWEEGYEGPWVVLTDLLPQEAEVCWYRMRTWVETGYKDFKRGLWGWHHSKMTQAGRVERLWLAMAVAQLMSVSMGCVAEEQQRAANSEQELPASHIARKKRCRPNHQPRVRRLSCVVRGRLQVLATVLNDEPLLQGQMLDEPWPQDMQPPRKLPSASERHKREKKQERKRRARARERASA